MLWLMFGGLALLLLAAKARQGEAPSPAPDESAFVPELKASIMGSPYTGPGPSPSVERTARVPDEPIIPSPAYPAGKPTSGLAKVGTQVATLVFRGLAPQEPSPKEGVSLLPPEGKTAYTNVAEYTVATGRVVPRDAEVEPAVSTGSARADLQWTPANRH